MTREQIINGLKDIDTNQPWEDDILKSAISALEQQPCEDAVSREAVDKRIAELLSGDLYNEEMRDKIVKLRLYLFDLPSVNVKPIECEDAVSRDFQIGDEVRIIGSDPIYDDCDVGWVIRNASEKVKTMYVMRNDGSAGEETKAEWYKTGRHNAMLAEVIKALPSITQKSKTGHWIDDADEIDAQYGRHMYRCQICDEYADYFVRGTEDWWHIKKPNFCPSCGEKMESEDKE